MKTRPLIPYLVLITIFFLAACGGPIRDSDGDGDGGPAPSENNPVFNLASNNQDQEIEPLELVEICIETENVWGSAVIKSVYLYNDLDPENLTEITQDQCFQVAPEETVTYYIAVDYIEGYNPQSQLVLGQNLDDLEVVDSITIEVNTNEPEPEPEPEPGCEIKSQSELSSKVDFQISPSTTIYLGESITLTWSLDMIDTTQASVRFSQESEIISQEVLGSQTFQPTQSQSFSLKVEYCGFQIQKQKTVTVRVWTQLDQDQVSVLSSGIKSSTVWMGHQDGAFYKSEDYGQTWNLVSSAREAIIVNGQPQVDASSITTFAELGSVCDHALVTGSENGFVFRSYDGGLNSSSLTGQDYAWWYFPSEYTQPYTDYPSRINFILPSPFDSGALFIGYDHGLAWIQDCLTTNVEDAVILNADNNDYNFSNGSSEEAVSYQGKIYLIHDQRLLEGSSATQWQIINDVQGDAQWIKVIGRSLYIGTSSQIYKFDGEAWSVFYQGASIDLEIIASNWFLAKADGIYLSRDYGNSWSLISEFDSGIIQVQRYGALLNQKIFVVTESGETYWIQSKSNFQSDQPFSSDIQKGNVVTGSTGKL